MCCGCCCNRATLSTLSQLACVFLLQTDLIQLALISIPPYHLCVDVKWARAYFKCTQTLQLVSIRERSKENVATCKVISYEHIHMNSTLMLLISNINVFHLLFPLFRNLRSTEVGHSCPVKTFNFMFSWPV